MIPQSSSFLRCATVVIAVLATIGSVAAQVVTYNGNGNTNFGGAVGGGSLTLSYTGGTTIDFTFTRGSGTFNNYLVFYFDTVSGGATSLPIANSDIGSPFGARRAIVNEFGSGISSFPSGFNGADRAYALRVSGQDSASQVYSIPSSGANSNSLTFVSNIGVSNNGNSTAASYQFSIPLTDLGITVGQSFRFVTTYLNPFDGGGNDATFRSDEAFVTTPTATGFSNTGFTTFNSFTPVPEPSTWAAGVLTVTALGFSQRRRFSRLLKLG